MIDQESYLRIARALPILQHANPQLARAPAGRLLRPHPGRHLFGEGDRVAYKAYQLECSRLRSRHLRVVWVYIERWFQRGEFYDSHGDDASQLGGDFIVGRNGTLRLAHPSHDPTDKDQWMN